MTFPKLLDIRRPTMKPLKFFPALAALALASGATHAQVVNGNFQNGLTGWTVTGDAAVNAGKLTLTTAFTDEQDGAFNLSGTPAAWIGDVETAAGAAPLAFDLAFPDAAYEGTAVQQSINVSAGQFLSFSWQFATQETGFLDHAFVVIDGSVFTLATRATAPGGIFSLPITQDGTVSLAFGVVDTGDVTGVSALSVSNVQLSAVVPEPAPAAMLLAGLGVMGLLVKRRRAG